jgi:hypothetical protein
MNLKKMRDFFLHKEFIYKNSSHILHICYGLRITSGVWKPSFNNFAS